MVDQITATVPKFGAGVKIFVAKAFTLIMVATCVCACASLKPDSRAPSSDSTVEGVETNIGGTGVSRAVNAGRPELVVQQSQFKIVNGFMQFERAIPYSQIAAGVRISIQSERLHVHGITKKPFRVFELWLHEDPVSYPMEYGSWSLQSGTLSVEVLSSERLKSMCRKKYAWNVSLWVEASSITAVVKDYITGNPHEWAQAPELYVFPISCE